MLIYPLVFILFFILASLKEHKVFKYNNKKEKYVFLALLIFFSIYIGLRIEVGGDWGNYYNNYFIFYQNVTLFEYLKNYIFFKDPLFVMVNYLSPKIINNYIFLNFILGIFFSYSLLKFAFLQSRPFFVILIAIPYYVNVIGMGYHRQAIAISFFLFGLTHLLNKHNNRFILATIFASLSHFTSIILLPLLVISSGKFSYKHMFFVITLLLILLIVNYDFLLITLHNYISISYSSSGAFIRGLMNALPGFLYLCYSDHEKLKFNNNKLVKNLAIISIILFLIIPISGSSTMIDRIALYLIPFQMIFWSKFLDVFEKNNFSNFLVFYLVSFGYYLALLVWVYFGNFSLWWFPYRNLFFELFF